MNGRRIVRLLWVATSNGVLFYWGLRFARNRGDGLAWMSFGIVVCIVCLAGWILELRKYRIARVVNVGTPAALAVLMASSVIWLPLIAKFQHSQNMGEAYEGAAFMLLLAAYPLCLAIITFLAYWLIDIEPIPTATGLGL